MRKTHLSRQEKAIENSLLKGEYLSVGKGDFEAIAQAVAHRKKDAVLFSELPSCVFRADDGRGT